MNTHHATCKKEALQLCCYMSVKPYQTQNKPLNAHITGSLWAVYSTQQSLEMYIEGLKGFTWVMLI